MKPAGGRNEKEEQDRLFKGAFIDWSGFIGNIHSAGLLEEKEQAAAPRLAPTQTPLTH